MAESDYDVVVAGGGPSGIVAAIATGRLGKRTVLLEKHPRLGGMGTNALVNNFCNAHFDGERLIIGGIFAEIRNELMERGAIFVSNGLEPYNHTVFGEIVERLCKESGVEVLAGCGVSDVRFEEESRAVFLVGDAQIVGRVVVDATGDAVIASKAGAPFWPRMAQDNPPMPLTYCYLFGPVDMASMKAQLNGSTLVDSVSGLEYIYLGPQPELKASVRHAREAGELTIPRERIAVAYSVPGSPEILSVNFGRVTVENPVCPVQLAAAEERGRAQVEEGAAFLKKYVPGCAGGNVIELARQIGVRESRQIRGLYRLSKEDVLGCRQFDDAIAQCCYSIDIHEPQSDKTTMIGLPRGQHYDIPYRCLVPAEGPGNLIVAGRSISATQEAMSSFRVSPSVMAIGEAAGTAAALVLDRGTTFAALPHEILTTTLAKNGAILN